MIKKILLLSLVIIFTSCKNKNTKQQKNAWKPLFKNDSLKEWKHNCKENTFKLKNGTLYVTGQPIGVLYSKKKYRNFEIQFEWKHKKYAGNSGLFIWTYSVPEKGLPKGIEIQILDPGYEEMMKKKKKKTDWFTCHGDIFPVGKETKFSPDPPRSPNGVRSFPRENRVKPHNNWNHYHVKAVNGKVELFVNGKLVSSGKNALPNQGYIAFESEGKPIEFRNIKIKELK